MEQIVIVHTENISRRSELKYFQIPLPGTIKKIIAVEVSVFLTTVLPAANHTPATSSSTPVTDPTSNAGVAGSSSVVTVAASANCPNPGTASVDPVSDTVSAGIRTQVFKIGAAVNPGFEYSAGVYSVMISVIAVDGDTPSSIAQKLGEGVNNTPLFEWNQYGSNNHNYKPTANANGDLLTLTTDYQHSFYASGSGTCAGVPQPPLPPSPPPLPTTPPVLMQYDPLFLIGNNEKTGMLSLQSPDATDIFFQSEVFREDSNIGFGDFSFAGEVSSEWIRGKKRMATDSLIVTTSPILEAYYKDLWGNFHERDISYALNVYVWMEKQAEAA